MYLSVVEFVERLRASDVLSVSAVDAMWEKIPESERGQSAESLVAKLVEGHSLTEYQAAALIAGRGEMLVLGEYIVHGEFGQNGQGHVFQARHRRLNYERTLKVVPPDSAAEHGNSIQKNGILYLVEQALDSAPAIGASRAVVRPAPRNSRSQLDGSNTAVAPNPQSSVPAVPAKPRWQAQFLSPTVLAVGATLFLLAGCLLVFAGVLIGKFSAGTPSPTPANKLIATEIPNTSQLPELLPIDDQVVNEQTELRLAALQKDNPTIHGAWPYSLAPGAPSGAQIDADAGLFSWTPTEEQGPGTYEFTIRITQPTAVSATSVTSVAVSFRVTVREVNRAPKLTPLPEQSAQGGAPFKLMAAASDPDLPVNRLSYSLRDAPQGATINPTTGELNWKPPTIAEGIVKATVVVEDDGSPSLRDEQDVRIRVVRGAVDAPVVVAPTPKPGDIIENSLKMKLVFIPPGEFEMGSPTTEKDHQSDEKLHKVRLIKGFYMGVYEVTQWEYEQVMGKNPSYFSISGAGKASVQGLHTTSQFPVENVSWEEAAEFCKKLSATDGRTYRLPTEAEWEYACRAKTKTVFHFGDVLNGNEANCNGKGPYGTNMKGKYLEKPTAVGSYSPNAFGLHDMHGNVWEWCYDWYQDDATDEIDPNGPSIGVDRVIRGGSWLNNATHCRAANRYQDAPASHCSFYGFRVVYVR